jgi:aminopeptidase N
VRGWADAWLRTTGHDTIRIEREGGEVVVTHPGVRPHLVVAGVYDRDPADASRLVLRSEVPVRLEPGREREPLAVEGGEPAAVVVCHHDLTFASVRFDAGTEAALRSGLASVDSALARVVVWTSWRDQVRHAEISPLDYLARVGRNLGADSDAVVVDAVLDVAQHTVLDRYLVDESRAEAATLLREVCRASLARAERDGSSSLALVAVRGLVAAAGPDQAGELRSWLGGAMPGAVPLDDELRWRVVVRLAALGVVSAAEIEEQLDAAPTQESALRATRARAARPDPVAKAAAWELMTGVGGTPASTSTVRAAASGFWVPGQGALLGEYVPRFLPAVEQVARVRGSWVAEALLRNGFPWHDVDVELLHSAEAVAADPAQSSTVRRHVGDAAYEYRLAHASRTRWSRM